MADAKQGQKISDGPRGGSKSAAPQLNLDEQKGAILFGFCLVKSYFILYCQDIISRIIGPSIYEPSFGHF